MAERFKALILVAALAGLAGCAYQDPLRLPDPYRTDGWSSGRYGYSPYGYSPYGYSHYGYSPFGGFSSYYGYGMTDPFFYRYGYPTYGYYRYPYPPVQFCVDANRDGRCDRRRVDRDDDDSANDRDHDGRGGGPVVAEPGRDRDGNARVVPDDRLRDPDRVVPDRSRAVPDSSGKKLPVPRADSRSSQGAAGMTPRTVPPPRSLPPTPKRTPAAPRVSPRVDDSPPPPRVRPTERNSS
jgi:hypothetical protein